MKCPKQRPVLAENSMNREPCKLDSTFPKPLTYTLTHKFSTATSPRSAFNCVERLLCAQRMLPRWEPLCRCCIELASFVIVVIVRCIPDKEYTIRVFNFAPDMNPDPIAIGIWLNCYTGHALHAEHLGQVSEILADMGLTENPRFGPPTGQQLQMHMKRGISCSGLGL